MITISEGQKSGALYNFFPLRVLSPLQAGPGAHRITSMLLPHLYSKTCIHNLEPARLVVYCAIMGYGEEAEVNRGRQPWIKIVAWLLGPKQAPRKPRLAILFPSLLSTVLFQAKCFNRGISLLGKQALSPETVTATTIPRKI